MSDVVDPEPPSAPDPAARPAPEPVTADARRMDHLTAELRKLQEQLAPALSRLEGAEREVSDAALPAWRRVTQGEPRLSVAIAILLMIALQLRLPPDLTPIGRWVLPIIELVLLVVLFAANPHRIAAHTSPVLRGLSLTLIAVASVANGWSVALLIKGLIQGARWDEPGHLLATGVNIWLTNVIVFAIWYWELDRGGPAVRAAGTDPDPDFLFPQMADGSAMFREWEPQFTDYAYVAFTNAAAFSPTDTMPLTRWAKLAMLLQSAISLVTAALVIARAVNILR